MGVPACGKSNRAKIELPCCVRARKVWTPSPQGPTTPSDPARRGNPRLLHFPPFCDPNCVFPLLNIRARSGASRAAARLFDPHVLEPLLQISLVRLILPSGGASCVAKSRGTHATLRSREDTLKVPRAGWLKPAKRANFNISDIEYRLDPLYGEYLNLIDAATPTLLRIRERSRPDADDS